MAVNDRCPRCGATAAPQERFCPRCGAALRETADARAGEAGAAGDMGSGDRLRRRSSLGPAVAILMFVAIFIVTTGITVYRQYRDHARDGYYRCEDDLFYRYETSWYRADGDGWDPVWELPFEGDYSGYYLGRDYDPAWGCGDFEDSAEWFALHGSGPSSG